ncbi:acyltransferase [Aquimarina sp. ERC-38]|uniref:acyltransferase family protein n=1 Tax=Aquimarina sp. ERC-38 TaxID=2949996 RepID=UPI0022479AF1|nr:acyltransferase [Aquimarina sp. ERC-38]UZO82531.1 acyltransferase [Aquimarina sp. ERC-38]
MLTNLQAFRFIFAVFVFASHLNYVIPEYSTVWKCLYRYIFREGFIGVTFFFMLSGYILAYRYYDSFQQQNFSFTIFLNRRIARLLPVYYLSLLIALPLTFSEFLDGDRIFYFKKLATNLFLLQSYIPVSDYYFSFNGVSWSISTELFFYLCFPGVFYMLLRVKKLIPLALSIVAIILLLGLIFFYFPNAYYWLYISPFTRIADFSIGIIAFLVSKKFQIFKFITNSSKREYLALGIGFVFLCVQPFVHENFKLSVYYWCPMFIILLVFGDSQGAITKRLAHPLWQYLGSLSFSFYLIHHTFFKYYQTYIGHKELFLSTGIVVLLLFLISLLSSAFLYHFIEEPARKLLRK